MAKNILIIMTNPLTLDGISSMVLNYFRHFNHEDLKYEFAVWNYVREDIKNEIQSKGGIIHFLPHRTRKPFQYYYALKLLMERKSYDIVHAHGNSSTLYIEMRAAKKAGISCRISHCHSSSCKNMFLHRLLKPVFDRSYTHAFACSRKAGDWLFNGPYEIINNGIELEKYAFRPKVRDNLRTTLGLNGKRVIGHVGVYNYAKNHDYLIDVFAALVKQDDDYRLMLVGAGKLMETVKEKIKKLGLEHHVLILGHRTDVPDLLQAMDYFVMPSHYEGLPVVLIEAQAAGLPCIVSSNITQEVNLTGLITYVSLEQPVETWANMIEKTLIDSRQNKSIKACKELQNAGYDINLEAKKLEKRYLSMLEGQL